MDPFRCYSYHKWPSHSWPQSCKQEPCAPKTRLVQKCLRMLFSSHPGWIPTDRKHFSCCCEAICAVAEETRICVHRGRSGWGSQGEHKALLRPVWLKSHLVGLVWCSTIPSNKKHNWDFWLKSFKNYKWEYVSMHTPSPHTEIQIITGIDRKREYPGSPAACFCCLVPCRHITEKGLNRCLRQKKSEIWTPDRNE